MEFVFRGGEWSWSWSLQVVEKVVDVGLVWDRGGKEQCRREPSYLPTLIHTYMYRQAFRKDKDLPGTFLNDRDLPWRFAQQYILDGNHGGIGACALV